MKKTIYTLSAVLGMVCASCSEDVLPFEREGAGLPISISAEYPVRGVGSRANDNGFVVDDAVGIFVVDYNRDPSTGSGQAFTPGNLVMRGNRADNVKFTFTGGRWEANYQLYWASKATPADFYGYYPFNENMQSVTEYAFSVYKNQDGTTADKSNYEQSDLLWAKAEKVEPTTDAVQLQYRHLMAGVTIQLQMGTGFEASEWAQLDKVVLIENVQTSAMVNLQTGSTTLSPLGEPEGALTPLIYNNVWRAVVVPQTVAAGKRVISVTVDGKNYELKKQEAVQYVSGKMHNFTITVNKNTATGDYTFELTADDIVAWIDDADLHDGLVRQYVIVDVNEAGTLSKVMAYRGIEADKVTGLKLQGNLNGDDLWWLREHCTHITDLNMSKVILQDGVLSNMGIPTMRHYVFPEKSLKTIGRECFFNATGLNFTNLSLPEGLETIEEGIPNGNFIGSIPRYIGELHLPSTLKYLRGGFENANFTGELHLPEGIIESCAPGGDFTGSLHYPSSLQKVITTHENGVHSNWGYKNMTGTVVIPRCMTKVDGFWDGAGFNHVEFHDGVTEICGNAFRYGNLSGELVLPPNCRKVSIDAFPRNKFSRIIFNDELRIIGENAFNNNPYLVGTLTLPKNVACIPGGCFADCPGITGLVIPANVDLIEDGAFRGCNGIASIVCEGEEPPLVVGEAFYGVNKDNFTVEVPKGCVEKYRNADGWKEFKRIAEYSNFVCRPAQANALNNAHDEALVLNADGAWTVKHKPDWVRLSKSSGKGKSEIQLTFLDMPHGNGMRRDSILFEMGDHTTYCVVSQYDYEHEEDSYLTLQKHSKGNGLDLVFMGDGWTGADISSGEYLDMVRKQTEYFFGIEPYKSHREYFNVYVTFPLSQEKGVNTMHTYVNNRFGTLYGHTDMWTIDHLLTETDEVYKYAVDRTPMTEGDRWKGQLILIPNSDEYEGVTLFRENDNCALSLCPPSSRPYPQDTRGTVQHEACGHGFGKLGDENIKYQAWIDPITSGQIDGYHNRGWYRNLATTSKMNQVWWADMIFDPRYSDQVDVFEGGYGYMRGVFRPENNSCMNYGIPYFNAPSRKDIMWRILEYSGERFSDEYFYSHDTNAWGDKDGQTRAGAAHASLNGTAITSSNNHLAPMVVNVKTMGDKVRAIRKKTKTNNR